MIVYSLQYTFSVVASGGLIWLTCSPEWAGFLKLVHKEGWDITDPRRLEAASVIKSSAPLSPILCCVRR